MSQPLPIDLLCAWARGTLPAADLEHCLFGDPESCRDLPDTLVADIADLTASDERERIDATGRVLEHVGMVRPADDYWTAEMLSFPPPAVITALVGHTPDRVLEEPPERRSGEGAIQLLREVLRTFLPGPHPAEFVVNETNRLDVDAEGVTIGGRFYEGDLFELRRTGTYPDVEIRLEDGSELEVGDLAIRELGFGGHVERDRLVRLSLTYSKAGFARATRMLIASESKAARGLLEDAYKSWLVDPASANWEASHHVELARLGFPGVGELLEHPGVLREVVGLGGFQPLYYLEQLLPANGDGFQYVINSVDGLEVTDAGVTLYCLCFRRVD